MPQPPMHPGMKITFSKADPELHGVMMPQTPILIVDDHAGNLKLLRVLLGGEGFEVRTALSATEALEVLKGFLPALILTDIQMPGMDGLEFIRLVKNAAATKAILVVAVTAYAMSGDEIKAREAGCDAYVTKPIDTRSLPALLRKLLEAHPPL